MGIMIRAMSGILSNEALERFPYWSPFSQTSEYNGKHFTVIQALESRAGSSQPNLYLIRFDDGALVEAEFEELVGAYRNGLSKYATDFPPVHRTPTFVYPTLGEVTLCTFLRDDGGCLVTLQSDDKPIATVDFPKGEKVYYVASPLSADSVPGLMMNMANAKIYKEHAYALKRGGRVIAPHAWLPYVIDDTNERLREAALQFGLECLARCAGIIVYARNGISRGMRGEIHRAMELGLDVIYVDADLPEDVFKHPHNWRANKAAVFIPADPKLLADALGLDATALPDKLKLELSVSLAEENVVLRGSYEGSETGVMASFVCTLENSGYYKTAINNYCIDVFGTTLSKRHLQLLSISDDMTKEDAVHQLQLEALVFQRAIEGKCWRPGGCFHNSNGFSYRSCGETEEGICDCYKAERNNVVPGFTFMSRASYKQGLCNYELMRDVLNEPK